MNFGVQLLTGVNEMNTPKQLLQTLENGYLVSPDEQREAARYIRELQGVIHALTENTMRLAEEVVALREQLTTTTRICDEKI
jgi:hypothetical protein